MSFSVLLGLLTAAGVLAFGAATGVHASDIFLNPHAAVIVCGGTFAAALICFPLRHFLNLGKIFIKTLTGQHKAMTLETINEIVRLSQLARNGKPLGPEIASIKNQFLKESLELLDRGGLTEEEFDEVLRTRLELQNERYKRSSATFKIIGKFPPAFGLVGTTMGMIGLLQDIGQENALERIGPSMSIALVATFYGLILANFLLIPIGENLNQASEDDLLMRRIVIDGVRLLQEQKHPILVQECLRSYLSPAERNKISRARAA